MPHTALNVGRLIVLMPSVKMQNVVSLCDIIPSVIKLNVVALIRISQMN